MKSSATSEQQSQLELGEGHLKSPAKLGHQAKRTQCSSSLQSWHAWWKVACPSSPSQHQVWWILCPLPNDRVDCSQIRWLSSAIASISLHFADLRSSLPHRNQSLCCVLHSRLQFFEQFRLDSICFQLLKVGCQIGCFQLAALPPGSHHQLYQLESTHFHPHLRVLQVHQPR